MAGTKYLPLSPGTHAPIDPKNGFRTPARPSHNGVDFPANQGIPVYSVSDGFVAHVGVNDDPEGYGSWLVIDSQIEHGLDFTYGHMPPTSFLNPRTGEPWRPGDRVRAGDQIAVVGNEGGSTGPHLHFEVSGPPGRFGGPFIDPMQWLDGAVDPRSIQQKEEIVSAGQIGRDLIDYSAGVPAASAVKAAGFAGAVRYVSPPRERWMVGKPIHRPEADDYRAQGLDLASNWQYGKRDFDGGYEVGGEHAVLAKQVHLDAGGPPAAPIYFSVDANPNDDELERLVKPYLQGAQDVIGKERMGVYGNGRTIHKCAVEWGIGTYFWQHGWDGDRRPWEEKIHPASHLYQYEIDKHNVAGIGVDRNRILKEDWGQWSRFAEVAPQEPAVSTPTVNVKSPNGYPIRRYTGPGFTEGHGPYERSYVHTTENQDWKTRAQNVADYQARQQDGSYHFLIDDEEILCTVDLDDTAWGVLRDNPNSVQIALVGTSGEIEQWSGPNPNRESRPKRREQWLAHEKQLDMLAYVLALVNAKKGIPLTRVDANGVGRDEKGVSSHNNYTYGSVALWGFKDGSHWDVPDTFPYDVVLRAANEYAKLLGGTPATPPPPPDPDAFPLPKGYYYGPLEGPAESISNLFGTENPDWKAGLKRWQEAVGIPGTGVYDEATKQAALRLQREMGWPLTLDGDEVNGRVWEGEWNVVIKHGYRFKDEPAPTPPEPKPIAPINPGPKTDRTRKIKDLTGPGHTTRFRMEATDLGVCCRTPSGRILSIFGDTFLHAAVGSPDWRSPVGLFSDTKNLDEGLTWHEAAGGDPEYARQLWSYPHNNPEFSTVLPSDVITLGSEIYLHVMVNKGLHNVVWTELHKSTDDGRTWSDGLCRFPADWRNGLAQLWTMALGPDGWVYVMSTSFRRADPVILQRVRPDRITDINAYEGWGYRPGAGWQWGHEPTPVLEKASSAEKFGEMSLRYIQGQWVLVTFDVSSNGGYDIDVRVFENITDNLYYAKKSSPIKGGNWGMEGDDRVAQLYGPSIIPGSALDAGFHIVVSQWNTGRQDGWPYRSMQFKIPVDPVVPPKPTGDHVPPPAPEPEPPHDPPAPSPEPEKTPTPPPDPHEIPWTAPTPPPVQSAPRPPDTSVGRDLIAAIAEIFRKIFRRKS